jgi:hypothetical protein
MGPYAPLLLFLPRAPLDIGIKPPALARAVGGDGFGPELFTVAR